MVRAALTRTASALRAALPRRLQARLWDLEYARGRWSYLDGFEPTSLQAILADHAVPGASILDLGCGTAQNLGSLSGYRYHGVDISETAIAEARAAERRGATYEVADILEFEPDRRHDVVLLREVLYYLPPAGVRRLLGRMPALLTAEGVVVVQIWDSTAYAKLIDSVRRAGLVVVAEPPRPEGGVNLVLALPRRGHPPNAEVPAR